MLRIHLHYAKPGMKLALPVPNPQSPDRSLLSAGYEISGRAITRMQDLGVRELIVRYPGLEVLDDYINPQVLQHRSALAEDLRKTLDTLQRSATAKLPYEEYLKQIAGLVEELLTNPAAVLFMDQVQDDDHWMLEHGSAVAYLSLLMGLRLDWYLIRQRRKLTADYARQVGNLGVGAMLHDIGLLHLEPEVIERYQETGDESDPDWQAHVRVGYELVRSQLEPSAAINILHHHQRYDGSGFPSQQAADGRNLSLAGDRIHIYPRITALADAFDELRHPAKNQWMPAVRAIGMLLDEPRVRWFDPYVLQAFLEVVPPYPPGVPVRLNDGRWAVPIDHTSEDPCRPPVQIIENPDHLEAASSGDDSASQPQTVDLREHPELHIAEAEGADVSMDNFDPPELDHLMEGAAPSPRAAALS